MIIKEEDLITTRIDHISNYGTSSKPVGKWNFSDFFKALMGFDFAYLPDTMNCFIADLYGKPYVFQLKDAFSKNQELLISSNEYFRSIRNIVIDETCNRIFIYLADIADDKIYQLVFHKGDY